MNLKKVNLKDVMANSINKIFVLLHCENNYETKEGEHKPDHMKVKYSECT